MDGPSLHPIAGLRQTWHDRSSEGIVGHLTELMAEIQRMIDSLNQGVTQDFNLTAEFSTFQAACKQVRNPHMTLALHPTAIEVLTQREAKEILHIVWEVLGARVCEAQVPPQSYRSANAMSESVCVSATMAPDSYQ